MVKSRIMAGMLMSTMAIVAQAEATTLTDFDKTGLAWRIVNDTVMGGRSNSEFDVGDGVLTFKGTLSTNGGGFALAGGSSPVHPARSTAAITAPAPPRRRGAGDRARGRGPWCPAPAARSPPRPRR